MEMLIRSRARKVIVTMFLLLFGSNLSAWNHGGHMSVGAIAYSYLKKHNPSTIPKIIAVLKKHPDFNLRWKHRYDSVPTADQDLFLFMEAARWPDDIKSWYLKTKAGEIHKPSHYIDHPVTFDNSQVGQPEKENILVAFKTNLDKLASKQSKDADKAISLCWIFHLMGDIHQPLHNASLFSKAFPAPTGDRGGNSFKIKGGPSELHAFWDDTFLPETKGEISKHSSGWFTKIDQTYKAAMTSNPVAYDPNYKFDAAKVSQDGVALAKSSTYQYKKQAACARPASAIRLQETHTKGNFFKADYYCWNAFGSLTF